MYISEYRQNEKNIFYLDFQKSVITQLSEFCKKNKLKLLIACNASRTDKNLVIFVKNYNFINQIMLSLLIQINLLINIFLM